MSEGQSFILEPYNLLKKRDELPHSWSVTSDSIAAWVAIQVKADVSVLVKSANDQEGNDSSHIYPTPTLIQTEGLDHLERMRVVDEYLRELHSQFDGELYLIDGSRPDDILVIIERVDEQS